MNAPLEFAKPTKHPVHWIINHNFAQTVCPGDGHTPGIRGRDARSGLSLRHPGTSLAQACPELAEGLVNARGSKIIPKTNNAVELVTQSGPPRPAHRRQVPVRVGWLPGAEVAHWAGLPGPTPQVAGRSPGGACLQCVTLARCEMSHPTFSVIIPAYNQAEHLGEAIQSVLDQTYRKFEVIIVNDASPDRTPEVVKQFDDPRIKYLVHHENRGLPAAKNTGIRASSGDLIAFLDADDKYQPEKLGRHVVFFEKNPDVGAVYNSRFELNYSSDTIREIVRPPLTVTLQDLVLGFPFCPSDLVLRKDWVFGVGLFDESYTFFGEDLDFNCRLALAGCQFASVDRALNYRRHHSGRIIKDLVGALEAILRPLRTTFASSFCPEEVLALRDMAFMNMYMAWAYYAFTQNETVLGQEFIREAVRLNQTILDGEPCRFVQFLVKNSIYDENMCHESLLRSVFVRLPTEMAWLSEQYEWAVARGYLLRGTRAIIWGRHEDGRAHFAKAVDLGAKIDEPFLRKLAHQLLAYEIEFGVAALQDTLRCLAPYLERIGSRATMRWFNACISVNQAFRNYHTGEFAKVPGQVIRAIAKDPKYLANRGVLCILLRSIASTQL